jgi:glycylpeptide N-tetradecanoyltransferase
MTATEALMASLAGSGRMAEMQQLMRAMNLAQGGVAANPDDSSNLPIHKFWQTQPVPQMAAEYTGENEPFETKTVADVRPEPYALVKGFAWESLDITNAATMDELYTLLFENYVEDSSATFRFDYSREFLKWALTPPGFLPQWHLAVRTTDAAKRLCAFISAVPARTRVYDKTFPAVEINFLCVHKSLRSKRLAPVLIKEITRRVNLEDIWQASYTAGIVIPKPVGSCQYFHRSLQFQKLCEIGFTRLPDKISMAVARKNYAVSAEPATPGVRPMVAADVPAVTALLNAELSKRQLAQVFTDEEAGHWLLPREGVVSAYVVAGADGKGDVTDFFSFYSLPSSITGVRKHTTLKAAYQYYHAATTVSLQQLMADALHFAYKEGFDVFNALKLMDNESFLKELKFKPGDGTLNYYLYNWKCAAMKESDVGLSLL